MVHTCILGLVHKTPAPNVWPSSLDLELGLAFLVVIYIGNTYILTSFTDVSFQMTGCSLKSSSCHTMLNSPTFLYVIILFITIKIMYYYKLYLLYTNNVHCHGPQPQADDGHAVTGM